MLNQKKAGPAAGFSDDNCAWPESGERVDSAGRSVVRKIAPFNHQAYDATQALSTLAEQSCWPAALTKEQQHGCDPYLRL
jgi:hypothetical protein